MAIGRLVNRSLVSRRVVPLSLGSLLTCWALEGVTACGGRSNRAPTEVVGVGASAGTGGSFSIGPGSGGENANAGAAAGDDAAGDSIGGAAGSLPMPTAGSGSWDVAVCEQFAALWRARSLELEPGEPTPPLEAPAPCYDCIAVQQGEAECSVPLATCQAFTDCARRHCLCQTSAESCARGHELCACLSRCGAAPEYCARDWARYMKCTNAACAGACE